MNTVSHLKGAGALVADHPEFQELCALFSTGALAEDEVSRLNEHLAECLDCRRFLEEFAQKADENMSQLAPQNAPDASSTESFDLGVAKRRLFEGLSRDNARDLNIEGRLEYALAGVPRYMGSATVFSRPWAFVRSFKPYLPYAAGFFLAMGLSLTIYWNGPRKLTDEFRVSAGRAENDAALSKEETKELARQHDELNVELRERANNVVELQGQIGQLQRRIGDLEASGSKKTEELQQVEATREALTKKLEDAQTYGASLRNELDSSRREHASESLKEMDLERRIEQLSATVKDEKERIEQQEAELEQQRELLAHDRDIRDLMGARQLYVAEVSDSDEYGQRKKPYARVFYTKEKSLIFYGFDLDKQPGVKNASTFQVWGWRGPNRETALNLGILFQDSSTNKRWILKIDDPMKLQQINAVYVTIEPRGGSARPTGKQLLFAYLRVDPNHP
jgi:hypothetical protein